MTPEVKNQKPKLKLILPINSRRYTGKPSLFAVCRRYVFVCACSLVCLFGIKVTEV